MKYKIFNMRYGAKVMVMDTEEFVEYYLQINSSDWHFCCGTKENFDNVSIEDAECIAEQYYDYCDDEEQVLLKHATDDLECWEKFKKVSYYDYDSFNDEPTTKYVFNIDEDNNIGHIPAPAETEEWFKDKAFVEYYLRQISKGYCNSGQKRALNVIGVDKHPWREGDIRISVQFG